MDTAKPAHIESLALTPNEFDYASELSWLRGTIVASLSVPAELLQPPSQKKRMLTLEEPLCRAMIADQAWPALIDHLLEEGFNDQGAMCLLYAGTPPHHTDGLPQGLFAHWLEHSGRSSLAAVVLQMCLSGEQAIAASVWQWWKGQHGAEGAKAFRAVMDYTFELINGDTAGVCRVSDMPAHWAGPVQQTVARARRALMRAVLSLPDFRDLTFKRRCTISTQRRPRTFSLRRWLISQGIHPDLPYDTSDTSKGRKRCLVVEQQLTAPQLILVDMPDPREKQP